MKVLLELFVAAACLALAGCGQCGVGSAPGQSSGQGDAVGKGSPQGRVAPIEVVGSGIAQGRAAACEKMGRQRRANETELEKLKAERLRLEQAGEPLEAVQARLEEATLEGDKLSLGIKRAGCEPKPPASGGEGD